MMATASPPPQRPGAHQQYDRTKRNQKRGYGHNSFQSEYPNKSRRQGPKRSWRAFEEPPSKPLCSVCQKAEEPKYKCPKCRQSYCGIQCCRDHKANCTPPDPAVALPKGGRVSSKYVSAEELQSQRWIHSDNGHPTECGDDNLIPEEELEGWQISDSMKEAVEKSSWLKKELADSGLRRIISNITAQPNLARRNQSKTKQEETLDHLKADNPRFKLFLDKLLAVAGVLEPADSDVKLEDWLSNEGDCLPVQLVLKPIHPEEIRRKALDVKKLVEEEDDSDTSNESTSDDDGSSSESSEGEA